MYAHPLGRGAQNDLVSTTAKAYHFYWPYEMYEVK